MDGVLSRDSPLLLVASVARQQHSLPQTVQLMQAVVTPWSLPFRFHVDKMEETPELLEIAHAGQEYPHANSPLMLLLLTRVA